MQPHRLSGLFFLLPEQFILHLPSKWHVQDSRSNSVPFGHFSGPSTLLNVAFTAVVGLGLGLGLGPWKWSEPP